MPSWRSDSGKLLDAIVGSTLVSAAGVAVAVKYGLNGSWYAAIGCAALALIVTPFIVSLFWARHTLRPMARHAIEILAATEKLRPGDLTGKAQNEIIELIDNIRREDSPSRDEPAYSSSKNGRPKRDT
jgi:hypothetical protein